MVHIFLGKMFLLSLQGRVGTRSPQGRCPGAPSVLRGPAIPRSGRQRRGATPGGAAGDPGGAGAGRHGIGKAEQGGIPGAAERDGARHGECWLNDG